MIKNKFFGFILTVLLGFISGIFGGGLGLGATTLALPGYMILGLVPNIKTSIGTTLISSPDSWGAVYKYYKAGDIEIIKGIVYSIFYIIGAYFGASINLLLSTETVTYLVSFVHFLLGIFFLHQVMK
jgi:uncharacterized membrane protein YfcA